MFYHFIFVTASDDKETASKISSKKGKIHRKSDVATENSTDIDQNLKVDDDVGEMKPHKCYKDNIIQKVCLRIQISVTNIEYTIINSNRHIFFS